MPYVQRDGGSAIIGVYATLQPGYAEEFLAADNAEVIAFLASPNPSQPASRPPEKKACALRVDLANGDVSTIGGSFNIMSIMRLDVGTFWCFTLDPITGSIPELVPNNGINVAISGWGEADFFIECRDHAGGLLIDPVSFGFTLYQF